MWLSEDKVPKGQQKQMKTHQNKKGDKNMAYHSLNAQKNLVVLHQTMSIYGNTYNVINVTTLKAV